MKDAKKDAKKDPKKAADFARQNAKQKSTGFCARYVANALEHGGFNFSRQSSAYMYHSNSILKNMGFTEINGGSPQKGDVYVEDQTKTHPDGHIAIYDGNNWVSDFVQKSDHVHAKDSGTNHYYRYSS